MPFGKVPVGVRSPPTIWAIVKTGGKATEGAIRRLTPEKQKKAGIFGVLLKSTPPMRALNAGIPPRLPPPLQAGDQAM